MYILIQRLTKQKHKLFVLHYYHPAYNGGKKLENCIKQHAHSKRQGWKVYRTSATLIIIIIIIPIEQVLLGALTLGEENVSKFGLQPAP